MKGVRIGRLKAKRPENVRYFNQFPKRAVNPNGNK